MNKKPEAVDEIERVTLRVEGLAPVARLQELMRKEPDLKLEIVAPRAARRLSELESEAMP